MDRLSFLKKLGTGIAIAVITPKVAADISSTIKDVPKDQEWGKKWAKECYSEWLKDKELGVDALCLWDMVYDNKGQTYIITAKGFGIIEITAMLSETNPNVMDIQKEHFFEYFVTSTTAR